MEEMGNGYEHVRDAALAVEAAAGTLKDEADGHGNVSFKDMLIWYYRTREQYRRLDEARKELYHLLDAFDKKHIPERFEKEGYDKVQVAELGRSFYPVMRSSARMVERDAAFAWLRSVGLGDLVTETVNASSLAAAVKDYILNNGSEPPETAVEYKTYATTGSSTYTAKE